MEDAVSSHKFKIGQSVNYTSGPFGVGSGSRVYKITQLLPPTASRAIPNGIIVGCRMTCAYC
jgi:hypothetical protein